MNFLLIFRDILVRHMYDSILYIVLKLIKFTIIYFRNCCILVNIKLVISVSLNSIEFHFLDATGSL